MAPVSATMYWACGTRTYNSAERVTKYTPAVTIVAAWIRAETGVGPAIASGSQTYSGICADLPATPTSMNNVIATITHSGASFAASKTWSNWKLCPKYQNIRKPAIKKPKSPTRLTMNAFLAAFEFAQDER